MIAYFERLYHEAKTKLTTYLALVTGLLVELPNAVSKDTLDTLHTVVSEPTYRHATAGLAAITIWSRVRRSIRNCSAGPKP